MLLNLTSRRYLLNALFALCFTSCVSTNKIYYLNDLGNQIDAIDSLTKSAVPKIQIGDKVSIVVSCADPNKTSFLNPFNNQNPGGSTQNTIGFLVDSTGNIDFPLIGKTLINGMTSQQASEVIKEKLKKYFLDPYVYVTLSGKVYILNGRGGYSVSIGNERLTILEALATPGSYEPDDKWSEVLVIREEGNQRTTAYIDLNSKNILNSPYYYLHNKDVIYIKPSRLNAILKSTSTIRNTIGLITGVLALIFLLRK